MKYLFIHQNFPGQFVHLAQHLAASRQNQVHALSIHKLAVPKGVQLHCYSLLRPSVPETHPMLQDMEAKVLRAEACAAAAMQLKKQGFVPDVIVAHPGWGETLFIRDVFPDAKIVMYCEYFYAAQGQDVGFDPEMAEVTFARLCKLRLKNSIHLHALQIADAMISPTEWQKSTFPAWAKEKISVIHDGIQMQNLRPNPKASIKLGANNASNNGSLIKLVPGDEVLTYVARNLEAVRGFHSFMRSLPKILAARPKARVIIVGGEDVSYGGKAPGDISWKEYMLKELAGQLDLTRMHFVGKIPYPTYLDLLQISKVHTYLTTPFVLSWSFLETSLAGVPMVASDTAPVREFAADLGTTLVDFFDYQGIADALIEKLAAPAQARKIRQLPKVDLKNCLQQQIQLLNSLA